MDYLRNLALFIQCRGKLISMGFAIKDGYIFHGFSINITNQCLGGFSVIQPCGVNNCPITSLEAENVSVKDPLELTQTIAPYLSNLFSRTDGQERFNYKDVYPSIESIFSKDYVSSKKIGIKESHAEN